MPQPPRASGSKSKSPSKKPASPAAKAAFWTLTCITLILLEKYMTDDPRHLDHAEKQKQKQRRSGGAAPTGHRSKNTDENNKHKELRHSSPTRLRRGNSSRKEHRMYPDPPQHSPHVRPATPPRPSQHREYFYRDIPTRYRSDSAMHYESRFLRDQRVDAWGRLRSDTPVKRVRFGGVRVHEYDGGEERGREVARTQRDIPPPEQQKKPEKPREIWGPVFPGDIWGAVFDGDIWGAVLDDDIWGAVEES